jgi:hypothetical protein
MDAVRTWLQGRHNRKAAILPVTQTFGNTYAGQEYLGIYPYVSKDKIKACVDEKLWINTSRTCYVLFEKWVAGEEPTEHS